MLHFGDISSLKFAMAVFNVKSKPAIRVGFLPVQKLFLPGQRQKVVKTRVGRHVKRGFLLPDNTGIYCHMRNYICTDSGQNVQKPLCQN